MRIKNRLVADPGGIGSRQDGNIKNQGFEIDIIINPVKGWNIVAGYGYNDNKYNDRTKMPEKIAWTPKHVANLWTSYKIMDGTMKGWALVQDLIL
jgi:iron complex outermembrane receptor protein